jgi:hypothetical protein
MTLYFKNKSFPVSLADRWQRYSSNEPYYVSNDCRRNEVITATRMYKNRSK